MWLTGGAVAPPAGVLQLLKTTAMQQRLQQAQAVADQIVRLVQLTLSDSSSKLRGRLLMLRWLPQTMKGRRIRQKALERHALRASASTLSCDRTCPQ